MNIKTLEVSGFIGCLRSLRLPFKKEVRSYLNGSTNIKLLDYADNTQFYAIDCKYYIQLNGNDLKLLQTLIKRGDEHAKALRLINVTCEINAPLFFWSEMDCYEVGVVNGCSESTMHTLKKEKLTQSNFETFIPSKTLQYLNEEIENNEKIEEIKGILPSGYLQKRVINFSYQTLQRIAHQRDNHKLPQWKVFIDWIKTLPLAEELILINKEHD